MFSLHSVIKVINEELYCRQVLDKIAKRRKKENELETHSAMVRHWTDNDAFRTETLTKAAFESEKKCHECRFLKNCP